MYTKREGTQREKEHKERRNTKREGKKERKIEIEGMKNILTSIRGVFQR